MTTDATAADGPVADFWEVAKRRAKLASLPGYFGPSALESLPPPAWSFGASAEEADEFLDQLLAEGETASAVPLADYQAVGEPLPEVGALGIVLDGAGAPRALVATTAVEVGETEVVETMKVLYEA